MTQVSAKPKSMQNEYGREVRKVARHSFIQMSKLSSVGGRISYIGDPERQEHLYARYTTREDLSFWQDLARESQEEFKRFGTEGKCIEARELIIALPEEYTEFDPYLVLGKFTEAFKDRYNVECISAIHHNKTMTNYHIHLIFSERRLLPEPEVKVATRSVFYDEQGKRVRTKKEITGEDGQIREGCRVIKKGEVYEKHLFSSKDERFKSEAFVDEVKHFYTDLINQYVYYEKDMLQVFNPDSVYLPTKKIGKNNPKADEIRADNEARKEWNQTADLALVTGIAETKIIEIKNEQINKEASRSVQKNGWLPGLFRKIIRKAKDFLLGLIREKELPSKPVLSVNMDEYRSMQKLMIRVQEEAREVKKLTEVELPKLEKQLSETTGLFKGKDRRRLQEEIELLKREIENRMDRMAEILKEDGYPDVQTFTRAYNKVTDLVKQYNRELAAWERKAPRENAEPVREAPPERESVRKQLREIEAEAKGRNAQSGQKPRRRNADMER